MSKIVILDKLPAYRKPVRQEGQPPAAGDLPIWSGADLPPAIGAEVDLRINRCGLATVLAYFVHEGYLGIQAQLKNPPDWYVRQNGRSTPCHAFGAEIRPAALAGEGKPE